MKTAIVRQEFANVTQATDSEQSTTKSTDQVKQWNIISIGMHVLEGFTSEEANYQKNYNILTITG